MEGDGLTALGNQESYHLFHPMLSGARKRSIRELQQRFQRRNAPPGTVAPPLKAGRAGVWEKTKDQRRLLDVVWTNPGSGGFFHIFCLNFLLLSGEHGGETWCNPRLAKKYQGEVKDWDSLDKAYEDALILGHPHI